MDVHDDIELRAAAAGDAAAIVELVRASFDPAVLELSIYGCDGIESYVRALIEVEPRGADTTFSVAATGDRPIAIAELRQLPDSLFLNYIAVAPEVRRQGVGTALLAAALGRARRHGQRTLALDVMEGNDPARAWYRGLGLREGPATDWWTLAPPGADTYPAAPVSGWAQAAACQRAFGFAEVGVQATRGSYRIGLLGRDWFRVTDPAALDDAALGATLRVLDPARSLLALVPRGALPERLAAGAERRATMLRLSGELDELTRRLEERAR
ncbi:MAG TPA: GNAT family N-acetyltransferase [Solirubrobacterales bacterium]|nr:GNAT family N-acetyltransferase [Solirubrobacterales bacterium]